MGGGGVLIDIGNKEGDISVLLGVSFSQRGEQAEPLTFYETIFHSQYSHCMLTLETPN